MAGVGAAPATGIGGAGLVDVVLVAGVGVVDVAVFCLPAVRLDDEVPEVEAFVVGVVTDEVAFAVAVVAGGATTLPLLKLTAPKAVLTEATGEAVEDGDVTALVGVVV